MAERSYGLQVARLAGLPAERGRPGRRDPEEPGEGRARAPGPRRASTTCRCSPALAPPPPPEPAAEAADGLRLAARRHRPGRADAARGAGGALSAQGGERDRGEGPRPSWRCAALARPTRGEGRKPSGPGEAVDAPARRTAARRRSRRVLATTRSRIGLGDHPDGAGEIVGDALGVGGHEHHRGARIGAERAGDLDAGGAVDEVDVHEAPRRARSERPARSPRPSSPATPTVTWPRSSSRHSSSRAISTSSSTTRMRRAGRRGHRDAHPGLAATVGGGTR